jgi:hypothetical protein
VKSTKNRQDTLDLKKEEEVQAEEISLSTLKTFHTATIIKT